MRTSVCLAEGKNLTPSCTNIKRQLESHMLSPDIVQAVWAEVGSLRDPRTVCHSFFFLTPSALMLLQIGSAVVPSLCQLDGGGRGAGRGRVVVAVFGLFGQETLLLLS